MRSVSILAIICFLFVSSSAYSDDSAFSSVAGGSLQPMMSEHPSVAMVKEKVTSRLSHDNAKVRCEFTFKNEGRACTVTMGFPEVARGGGDSGPYMRLKGFKSWVDGKPVTVSYLASKGTEIKPGSESYDAWYTKHVPFDAQQTRIVVDEYTCRLGFSNTAGEKTIRYFDYVIKSGRNWKGPIGEAVIDVDLGDYSLRYYDIDAGPKPYQAENEHLVWTLKNFEPKEDIHIRFTPRLPMLNGKNLPDYDWEPFYLDGGVVMACSLFLGSAGVTSNYDTKTGKYSFSFGKHSIEVKSGSKSAVVDGTKKITLSRMPYYNDGDDKLTIPVSAVVTALGGKTWYDEKSRRYQVLLKP